MKINSKLAVWIFAFGLFVVLPLQAQPWQGGGLRGMMRGGGGVEQILVFLAYDEKMKVSDEQWVKLRTALKESYAKQVEMREQMSQAWALSRIPSQAEDNEDGREAAREAMRGMREEMEQAIKGMQEKVTAVLDEKQTKLFEKHLKEMQERRERRGGGRWGRGRGGGGRGGDSDAE